MTDRSGYINKLGHPLGGISEKCVLCWLSEFLNGLKLKLYDGNYLGLDDPSSSKVHRSVSTTKWPRNSSDKPLLYYISTGLLQVTPFRGFPMTSLARNKITKVLFRMGCLLMLEWIKNRFLLKSSYTGSSPEIKQWEKKSWSIMWAIHLLIDLV